MSTQTSAWIGPDPAATVMRCLQDVVGAATPCPATRVMRTKRQGRYLIATVELFDGQSGTVQIGRWGGNIGWETRWLDLPGGTFAYDAKLGAWRRIPTIAAEVDHATEC